MSIKEQLCEAFCGTLTVREVPIGYAVGTDYAGLGDDPVGFYIERNPVSGEYRIMDDAMFVPTLEALGADFGNSVSRREAFHGLLEEYGVKYDPETFELHTNALTESQLPKAAINFLAFLLRAQDLAYMTIDRVASTFKEDAIARIKRTIGDRAVIEEESFVVDERLSDFPADLGIRAEGQAPLALFFGVSESKIYQAMCLDAFAENEGIACSVVALLESEKAVPRKALVAAMNHLDGTHIFKGDEASAINKIAQKALGSGHSQRTH